MKPVKKIFSILLAVAIVCTTVTWPSETAKADSVANGVKSEADLQKLIDDAHPGDVLNVWLSSFKVESIGMRIEKPITINFNTFDDACVITSNYRIFYIPSKDVHLKFNDTRIILDGSKSSSGVAGGGAIHIDKENVSIEGANFSNWNDAELGGAIYINDKGAKIAECSFRNCNSVEEGGAIYVNGYGAQIENCHFEQCTSRENDAGAIFVRDSGVKITDCTFRDCKALGGDGGAIRLSSIVASYVLNVENCRFYNCEAPGGEGQWVYNGVNYTYITNCTRPYDDTHYASCEFFETECRNVDLTPVDNGYPTCTEDGWKKYYECLCGLFYSDYKPGDDTRIGLKEDLEVWKKTPESSGGGYLPAKGHEFEFSENGNTLIARCKNDDEHVVTLSLSVRGTTYSEKTVNAEIYGYVDHASWEKYGLDYDFYYEDYYTGTRLPDAPVDVGTYRAVIEIKQDDVVKKSLDMAFGIHPKPITEESILLQYASAVYDESPYTNKVNPKKLDESEVVIVVPSTYSGEDQIGSITVDLDGDTGTLELVKGIDYDVSTIPAQVIEPGDYTATINFKGDYTGTVIKNFTLKRNVGPEDVTVVAPASTGKELNDSIVVSLDGKAITEGTDYDITFSPDPVKERGVYTATITFKGYNVGTIEKEFSVTESGPDTMPSTPAPTPTPPSDEGTTTDDESDTEEEVKTKPVYRLYNRTTGDHLLTVSEAERDAISKAGYKYEGIAFMVTGEGKKVFRLFNPGNREHFYTASEEERDILVADGWTPEGVAFLSGGEEDVYRFFTPSGMHVFTTNAKEMDTLVNAGWTSEKSGFKAN